MSAARFLLKKIAYRTALWGLALAYLLAACQPAPNPTQRARTVSPTAEQTNGDVLSKRTATVSPKSTLIPKATPRLESTLDIEPEGLEGVEIQYLHAWSGEAGELTNELVQSFNNSNQWGITVEATAAANYNDIYDQVMLASDEGNTPNLVVAYDYQALNWDAEHEILVDLSTYVDDPAWGWSADEQSDFIPILWQQAAYEDRRIGIPAQANGQMLYYNTTWAQELGFRSPPSTVEQFKRQACAAANANQEDNIPDNNGTGGWIISTDYSTVMGWLEAFGSSITRSDGKGYRFNTPQVEDALGYLRGLYEDGCAWLTDNQVAEDDFANRRGLFAAGSTTGIPYQQAALQAAGSSDEWTVIPFPSAAGHPAIDVYGPSYVVLKSTPEEQLASWLFAKWLLSPENQARWVQATTSYPIRESAVENIDESGPLPAQWEAAVGLLDVGFPEPKYRSWDKVRWAVSDATTQLFRWYFTMDQLPDTVRLLDRTATELHNRAP